MSVAHVGLVHRDPCECKVKGFRAVSSIERNVSNRRHLQGVRQSLRTNVVQMSIKINKQITLHIINTIFKSQI